MAGKKVSFNIDATKIITAVATVIVLGFGKAAFDVYAFSQTKHQITKKLKEHDESLLSFGSAIDQKAEQKEVTKLHRKVDKVLTILCTMSKNKPTDCIGE